MLAALLVVQVPVATWEKAAPWLFVTALVLLVLVLLPFIGKVVNNSRRWIPLGILNFQPSELAKVAMCLYAASYMTRKMEVKEDFLRAVWPMAVALGFTGFLLLRARHGRLHGDRADLHGRPVPRRGERRMFLLSGAMLVASFVLVIASSPEKRSRIFAYLEPWHPEYALARPTS